MEKTYYIYTHTSPSGKVYVGQTISIRKRWGYNGEHYMSKKKDGTYVQYSFAKAILKYGWKNFKHEIILEGISKSEADYAEKYLIRWYKIHGLSYNITEGGEGTCCPKPPLSEERKAAIREFMLHHHPMKGKKLSPDQLARITYANRNRIYTEERRAAMAESARKNFKGRSLTLEVRKKMSEYRKAHPETWIGGCNKKEVHQYDLTGNYITSFSSATEAREKCGISEKDILRCANGQRSSANGYIWTFEKVDHIDLSKYKIVKTAHGARLFDMSEEGKRKRRDGHGKKVNQYSLDGKYITTYNSITDAKEALGYKGGGIGKCCLHKPKYETAAGFLWEYDTVDNRKDKNSTLG